MAESALRVIFALIYAFLGSLNIGSAIREYKKEHYTACGFSIMVALWFIFEMAEVIFVY